MTSKCKQPLSGHKQRQKNFVRWLSSLYMAEVDVNLNPETIFSFLLRADPFFGNFTVFGVLQFPAL